MSSSTEQRKLAAIMFTDMVGYSALAQRNDRLALALLEEHRTILRGLFPRFNGTEIKTIGDAFLVEFGSALEAAQCAIEIQRALGKRNHDVTTERRIELKIGIHIGDVVHRDGDVFGDGVNIASRIEALAGAGGICVSMDVERQIRNALEARFEKLAAADLKNISTPMELFRIVLPWESAAGFAATGAPAARKRPAAAAGLAVAVLALVLAAGWWSWQRIGGSRQAVPGVNTRAIGQPQTNPAGQSVPDSKSIAVLAFANLSDEKDTEYFSDGVSEELLNMLAKVPGLKVSARTSAFSFKGRNVPVPEIARQLGVAYVLEGSIRKAGDHVRITVQLIKGADGFHVWSEDFQRELKDIFAVQDQLAALIARHLQVELGPASASGTGTTNVEALRLYLQGREQWNLRTEKSLGLAEELFRQALALDPTFARAHVGLADAWSTRSDFVGAVTFENRSGLVNSKVLAEVKEALRLDPNLPEAYATLGMVLADAWRIDESVKNLRRAVELNPNYATAHQWLALAVDCQGRLDEGLAHLQRAVELDPLSHRIHDNLAQVLMVAGRPAEALQEAEKALELMPDSTVAAMAKVWSLSELGRAGEALPTARRLLEATEGGGSISTERVLCQALVAGGASEEVEVYLHRLEPGNNARRFFILMALGRGQQALPLLDAAWLRRADVTYLLFSPRCDSVRDDSRFINVLQTAGLAEAQARALEWRKTHPPQKAL